MQGFKLLIVDYDIAFVDQVITQLKEEDISISWILKSNNILARINHLLPDVVILNANIRGMNTLEILKNIKVQCPLIEVIMLAEKNNIKEAIRGMQRGAVDYLKKPLKPNDLVRKIKLAYQKKVKHQEKISRFEKILA